MSPEPLALPTSDPLTWLARRCDGEVARARELLGALRATDTEDAGEILAQWDEVNRAVVNALCVAGLMANVHPDQDVRSRGDVGEQDAQRLITEIGLDRDVFEVLSRARAEALPDDAARRVLAHALRDFRRAGVDRDEDVRERLRAIADRQTELAQEFARNIRDDVRRVRLAPDQLDGLPEDYRAAHPPGEDGLVELTTDYPDYLPLLTFGSDRAARAAMLVEFRNRAWPANDGVLRELLGLRREQATLLGYADWPSYDAEVKMIGSGPAVPDFIERIAALAEEPGRRDLATLLARVRRDHPDATQVDGVDKAYYTELLRRELFGVDAQQVRGYFDFTRVRSGLLAVTSRLFGIEYAEVEAPAWHEDVTTYDVWREGRRIGRIHLDLHPRAGKFSHAAMFPLVQGLAGRQLAEGVLVCNFSRGLLEHDHVVTLFHEFGHLVHHVLAGEHSWTAQSGVATEWDFVEAPSQMLEEWAWDAEVLGGFARDADDRAIPADLVARMKAATDFGKGVDTRTQMFYAATSYWFHQDVPEDLTASLVELQRRYDLLGHVEGTHFHASFGHLEGYGSGYYTYLWSLVIAKDLFSAFDPADLLDTSAAHRYRDRVLARGGSADAADLVEDFLGRPYSFDAFEAWLAREPQP